MNKRDVSTIEELLHRELTELAEKIPGTEAIYKGHDPEEQNMVVYYLLIPGSYNPTISDSIADVDVSLSIRFPKLRFSVMRWSISENQASNYPFLGKHIHQRLNNLTAIDTLRTSMQ